MPSRPQVMKHLSATGLDDYARAHGFPSAAALNAVIVLGAKLQAGGRVEADDVKAMTRAYSNVPPHFIAGVVQDINAQPDPAARFHRFTRAIGVDHERAHAVCANYAHVEAGAAVESKLNARDETVNRERGFDEKSREANRERHEEGSLRADIERSMRAHNPFAHATPATAEARRHALAGLIDHNATARVQHDRWYDRVRRTDPYAGDKSRRFDVAHAFAQSFTDNAAKRELDLAHDKVAEQFSNDMGREFASRQSSADRAAVSGGGSGGSSSGGDGGAAPPATGVNP